jgi:ATP-dependent exoDNAse (exonuclease V) alpha subunit
MDMTLAPGITKAREGLDNIAWNIRGQTYVPKEVCESSSPGTRPFRRARSVTYGFGELDTLVPAYAATIHKSQGSEYPAVIMPVLTQHYPMLQRNLLYTGVTRGKRLVIIVGQKKAIAIAVRNVSGRRRWSKLDEWLRNGAPSRSTNSSKAG